MRRKLFYYFQILLVTAGLFLFQSRDIKADSVYHEDTHTVLNLVPNKLSAAPGDSIAFSLNMTLDNEWHVYWQNPGDSGMPPRIQWTLPEGFSVKDIEWPVPQKIVIDPLVSYGYEGDVKFIHSIKVPDSAAVNSVANIKGKVQWLACKIECVPGEQVFNFNIPITTSSKFNPDYSTKNFYYPKNSNYWSVQVFDNDNHFVLELVNTANSIRPEQQFYFYPLSDSLIHHGGEQKVEPKGKGHFVLVVEKSDLYDENESDDIEGLIVSGAFLDQHQVEEAFYFSAPLQSIADRDIAGSFQAEDLNLLLASIFAFIGGLILNLMPCVLPVLSLKIMSLIEQSGEDGSKSFLHGIYFTAGILSAFWVLAGLLIGLKLSGQQIGWGFQFQSPIFLIVLTGLFVFLSLNLFGLFEIGASLTQLNQHSVKGLTARGSFLNGVLATIVATPCTAPFMGSAIGYAVFKPPIFSFVVFTFLGLGMASPYLILSAYPKALSFIPKPGPWMNSLKKFFGLIFLATAGWLSWVYYLQLGQVAVLFLYGGLGVFALSCFFYGRSNNIAAEKSKKEKAGLLALTFFVLSIAIISYGKVNFSDKVISKHSAGADQIQWQTYSAKLINDLRKEGKPILLDFTASWCLTCQVNERVALSNSEVVEKFKKLGVVGVKADWTNYNKDITRALKSFGKSGIPLYVVYPADSTKEPFLLPEILTPGIVLDALDKI